MSKKPTFGTSGWVNRKLRRDCPATRRRWAWKSLREWRTAKTHGLAKSGHSPRCCAASWDGSFGNLSATRATLCHAGSGVALGWRTDPGEGWGREGPSLWRSDVALGCGVHASFRSGCAVVRYSFELLRFFSSADWMCKNLLFYRTFYYREGAFLHRKGANKGKINVRIGPLFSRAGRSPCIDSEEKQEGKSEQEEVGSRKRMKEAQKKVTDRSVRTSLVVCPTRLWSPSSCLSLVCPLFFSPSSSFPVCVIVHGSAFDVLLARTKNDGKSQWHCEERLNDCVMSLE